ncbi:hypothetical protein BJ138DRAFT_987633, partial [Hygrophoropsis aurantiaca]
VPTTHPTHLRRVPASQIITGQHTTLFLEALGTLLRGLSLSYIPRHFDTFDLYSRLVFQLPAIAEVSSLKLKNIVRASPPIARNQRRPAEPAHLDFVFVQTSETNKFTEDTCLEGLRVAQVCAIFKVPDYFPSHEKLRSPLAYIEWFTPIQARDNNSGMFIVSRSTRMHRRHAEIVPINRIVRSCHLIPDFGRHKDPSWHADNV